MTEGLFRIPGSNSEIQSLKTKFDAGIHIFAFLGDDID